MGTVCLRILSSSWLNVRTLTCFGSFCLFLLLCALVSLWRDLTKNKASREGRGCAHRALLLLPSLLLFSSFSFGSSLTGYYSSSHPSCGSISSVCMSYCSSTGYTYISSSGNTCTVSNSGSSSVVSFPSCSVSCSPPSNATLVTASTWSQYFASGSYCDPSSNCVESAAYAGSNSYVVTQDSACFPKTVPATAPVTSSSSNAPPPVGSCPVGYYLADASGCVCTNGSGSYVQVYGAPSISSCNGGNSTAPTLSPVSPVTSNGTTSCPSGTASISGGGSTSCYQIVIPPATNPTSTPSPSGGGGGGGGGSTFHLSAPTKSSNGQLTCPPGASTIGSGSTLECIVIGPPSSSTSPTASGTSATSSTGSTSSSPQYPTSFSMPALPSVGVTSSSIGSLYTGSLTSSGSCPSPVTFDVMNHTFSISFQYACQMAAIVRPIIIGVFTFASVIFVLK